MLLFVSILFIRSLRSSRPPLSFYNRKSNAGKEYSNHKRFPYLKGKGSIRQAGKLLLVVGRKGTTARRAA
jgi:hypothetical protein